MATFLETKIVAGEDSSAVPCRDTPNHIPKANKMESTMASHIATHEQFPSVHLDQVADKLFSGYVSVSRKLLAAAATFAEPIATSLLLYWHPHRLAYTCIAFHLDWQLRLTLNLDISNYSKLYSSGSADFHADTTCSVGTVAFSGTGFLI